MNTATSRPRLIVAITGASGAVYGVRLLEQLRASGACETHLVMSSSGAMTAAQEMTMKRGDIDVCAARFEQRPAPIRPDPRHHFFELRALHDPRFDAVGKHGKAVARDVPAAGEHQARPGPGVVQHRLGGPPRKPVNAPWDQHHQRPVVKTLAGRRAARMRPCTAFSVALAHCRPGRSN